MAETKIQIVLQALDQTRAVITNTTRQIQALEAAGGKSTGAMRGASTAVGGLRTALAPIAGAVAAAFSVQAVLGFTRSVLNSLDSLKDFSEEVGIAAEKIGGLQFGAALNGLDK